MNPETKKPQSEILDNSVNSVSKPAYDLAGQVIGLAMKVHRTLGFGFYFSCLNETKLTEFTKLSRK